MANYYFDTSIWLNYFNEKQFYHKEATIWFEKVSQDKNLLLISPLIGIEIKNVNAELYERYKLMSNSLKNKINLVKPSNKQYLEATELNEKFGFGLHDFLHIILARDNNAIAVSADIRHWPRIGRELNTKVAYITDFSF